MLLKYILSLIKVPLVKSMLKCHFSQVYAVSFSMLQLYVRQWNFDSFEQLLVSLVWPFTGRTQAPHMTFNPTKRPTVEQLITPKHRRQACLTGHWRHKLTAVLHTFHMRDGNRRRTWHWHPSQMLRAQYRFKPGANRLGEPNTKLNQMNKSSHMQMCVMFLPSVLLITDFN